MHVPLGRQNKSSQTGGVAKKHTQLQGLQGAWCASRMDWSFVAPAAVPVGQGGRMMPILTTGDVDLSPFAQRGLKVAPHDPGWLTWWTWEGSAWCRVPC